jgi:hypothetical protein
MQLIGCFDNELISNGFLIPIYFDVKSNRYYLHELSDDYKQIKSFKAIDIESYKHDKIIKFETSKIVRLPVAKDGTSYFVLKHKNSISWGSFLEMSTRITQKILANEIKSKTLIKTANKIFDNP